MSGRFAENALFFREYLRNFHSTGALLPSGRFLARALARFVDGYSANGDDAHDRPRRRRILEVGPGTGAVTRRIIAGMGRDDTLDLVELNDTFVRGLRQRFQHDPAFQAVADRARVLHSPIEDLPREETYDVIVSGLPLNNFSAELVERILAALLGLLSAEGTLSFFEYIAVRPARALVSGRAERTRLRGVARAMRAVLEPCEIRREAIWLNVPPAWVHHLRRGPAAK
jgi:phospholipid N-methyltransferase